MKLHRYSRPMAAMAAALVLGLTVFTIQQAYAVTTVASASRVRFTVANGAFSPNFSLGTIDSPVHMMTSQRVQGFRAVAQVVVAYSSLGAPGNDMTSWNGQNWDASVVQNFTTVGGANMHNVGWGGSGQMRTVLDGAGRPILFNIQNTAGAGVTQEWVITQVW